MSTIISPNTVNVSAVATSNGVTVSAGNFTVVSSTALRTIVNAPVIRTVKIAPTGAAASSSLTVPGIVPEDTTETVAEDYQMIRCGVDIDGCLIIDGVVCF